MHNSFKNNQIIPGVFAVDFKYLIP